MEYEGAWRWVLSVYALAYLAIIVFTSSIAIRISRVRKRLGASS